MGQQEKQNNIFCETIKSHACRNWPWTECDIWVLRFITVFPTIRIYQMQLAKFNRTNFDLHICMRCVLTVSTLPGCAATSRASGYKQTGSLPLAGNLSKRQEWLVESCGSCDKFRFFCRVDLFFVWDSQSLCISVHICEKSEVDWGGREAKGVAEDAGTATTAARPTFWWRRTRWATERISEPSCAEKSISTHGLPHVTTCYHIIFISGCVAKVSRALQYAPISFKCFCVQVELHEQIASSLTDSIPRTPSNGRTALPP